MSARVDLRSRLFARRHTALLATIVIAFAVRPVIGDVGVGPVVFSLAVLLLFLVALYIVQVDELVGDPAARVAQRRRRRVIAWALAVPAIVERLVMIGRDTPHFYVTSAACWFGFLAFVTWTELRSVLEQREITGETISMAISVYLLIGVTWALLYLALFFLDPQAFNFATFPTIPTPATHTAQTATPVFIYFSLTTLSTVGFGDITPVSLPARYAAVAEAITGQLYLAILVARLVSMQLSGGRRT